MYGAETRAHANQAKNKLACSRIKTDGNNYVKYNMWDRKTNE